MKYRVFHMHSVTFTDEWEVEATSTEAAEAKVIVRSSNGDFGEADCKRVVEDTIGEQLGQEEFVVRPLEAAPN